MTIGHYLLFGVGGGLGAVTRAYLSDKIDAKFPFATLIVNVGGSFLIGFAIVLLKSLDSPFIGDEELLVGGFCGGFTTFSSFSYQTLTLFQKKRFRAGTVNIVLTMIISLMAVWGGTRLGSLLG